MTRIFIAFLLLCGLSLSRAFVIEDCGSEVGQFSSGTISTCDMSEERCSFLRGTDIKASLKFTPNKDVTKVEARAFGVLLDVPIPFPLEKPDVCKDPDSGINCPLKKGQEVEYKSTFFLEKKTPALSVDVMWEFVDEDDKKILCVRFPAKIK